MKKKLVTVTSATQISLKQPYALLEVKRIILYSSRKFDFLIRIKAMIIFPIRPVCRTSDKRLSFLLIAEWVLKLLESQHISKYLLESNTIN